MMNKFNYIIDTFKTIYDLGSLEPDVSYGINQKSIIQINNSSNSFFDSFDNDINKQEIVFNHWKERSIPFFFVTEKEETIIEKNSNCIIINYDIIASSFLFLSGWLEIKNNQKDNLNRLLFENTLQHKLGISHLPVVNYYLDILKTAIELAYSVEIKPKHNQYSFITSVSHDIDKCKTGWKEEAFHLIKNLKFFSLSKLLIQKIFIKDIWFNLDEILEYEKLNRIHSVFYFLTKHGKYKDKIENADYKLNEKTLKPIYKSILENNSEIGLHGSFGSSDSYKQFKVEISDIKTITNGEISGNRFHYLQYNINNTPDIIEESQLNYDMSLGFAESIGFRNGICHPFRLYNFKEDRSYNYLEIPLLVMDVTLFNKNYMNLSSEEAFFHCKGIISEVSKFKGIFTVLWHNNSYSKYKYNYRKIFIERLLSYCISQKTVFKSAHQIIEE